MICPSECLCGCGGTTTTSAGYTRLYLPGHYSEVRSRAGKGYRARGMGGRQKYDHILKAEAALGKPLPAGAEVHHVNGDRRDNRPGNLVVCQDAEYHKLLHWRQRAKDACGNPDHRRCGVCKMWDDISNLRKPSTRNKGFHHPDCHNERQREKRRARRAAM